MKPDYTELDKALIQHIHVGVNKMVLLEHRDDLKKLTASFCVKQPGQHYSTPHFRIIDRRLQALRKKGTIAFKGGVWIVC